MSKNNKTVQEKMTELTETVNWFQSPSFTLEGAVDKYKHAEKLAREIEHDLTELKNEIEVVQKRFNEDA